MNSINKTISTIGIILALMMIPRVGISQENKGSGHCPNHMNIPGLTDDQQSRVEELKTIHQKQMLELNAKKETLEAELNQLEIADKAEMDKINAKIDEISAVQNQIAKVCSNHRQEVRAILTPEQRVEFDSRASQRHCKQGMQHGKEGAQPAAGCPQAK